MDASLSDEALEDARTAIDWYIEGGAWAAAVAFGEELAAALQRIRNTPGLGTPGPAGTRTLPLHRFKFSLVYRLQGNTVRVIAVASHRRRPRYWRGR